MPAPGWDSVILLRLIDQYNPVTPCITMALVRRFRAEPGMENLLKS
jgi:hypothetical protein